MSDYVGSETIDSYHIDASSEWALRCDSVEIDSVQAEENLCIFGVACEKLQIPRSCIATSKDFKEKNVRACVLTLQYKKIELTLVLFVMRGLAYNLPKTESIMDLLKSGLRSVESEV